MADQIENDDAHWRQILSPEEYRICRQSGTEPAFSGEYWDTKTAGVYLCKCCQTPLFDSLSKFDSGCGWPSFFQPLDAQKVLESADNSLGMQRIEINCRQCGCHLGHVFNDGPRPTGLRYCVNSASVNLQPTSEADDS